MTTETREHAIAIAASILAARDLALLKDDYSYNSPKATAIISDAVSKATRIVEAIDDTIRRRTPAP